MHSEALSAPNAVLLPKLLSRARPVAALLLSAALRGSGLVARALLRADLFIIS